MDESPFITVLHKWISDNPIDNDNSIDNNTFNQKLNRLEFKIILNNVKKNIQSRAEENECKYKGEKKKY